MPIVCLLDADCVCRHAQHDILWESLSARKVRPAHPTLFARTHPVPSSLFVAAIRFLPPDNPAL